jgi:hypothetical protein
MKTLSVVTVAILLGLSGAAMAASGNQVCGNYCTNSTGPNPFMPEFSTPASSGSSAFAQYPVQRHVVQHHVVHRHVEK